LCTAQHGRPHERAVGDTARAGRHGGAANSPWPRTAIATAALQMIPGVDVKLCRTPEILADAAWWVLTSNACEVTGQFFIDDELLARHGVTDLDRYSVVPGTKNFIPDFFVD
jgi:citronellol/citronellal dehydrogenase